MKVLDFVKDNIVILDGATGSLMQKMGFPAGIRPETANITNPEMLVEIHKSYFDAGSNIVTTNTFGANPLNFSETELENIIRAAIENVRKAASLSESKQPKYVTYDIGPTGKLLAPYGDLPFEDAVEIFGFQAKLAEKYGADMITIETMNDSYETKAAILGVKENCSLPVFVTNAYNEDERLLTGAEPEAMVAMLEGLGADAVGLNCSFGPDKLLGVARRIVSAASIPVIFKPNAGLPKVVNGKTVYDITPEYFTECVMKAVDMGANIIGGCCGTDPSYISLLAKALSGKTRKPEEFKNNTVVSSYSHTVEIGKRPVIIGERINPTGKKLIKKALAENDIDYLLKEGIEQQKCGAHILDVNCGLPEIDEKKALVSVVSSLQTICNLPLQIDTSDASAMEAALRIYNGKAVINSVNGKQEVMDSVFPLAKKYGGVLIALTLDEKGIPDTPRERLEIARKIIEEAKKYGIDKKNIIFDPLTLTVSADPNAAKVTLESVKLISEKTGCGTCLGVSNVSFGLPQRNVINSFFYTLAMETGLSAGIINPKSVEMMNAYRSFSALKGFDESCLGYITDMKDVPADSVTVVKNEENIRSAIFSGRKELASKLTLALLETDKPLDIINNEIIPALDVVGKNFENKKIFLPELLLSAEAAKSCFEVIKDNFGKGENQSKYTIVLATVKGDIHDIGKNIVKLLLENYGYNVIDLGKDVPCEKVLETAKKYSAKLVGLSALMTTTVPAMKETIELLHSEYPECKVVVGGAVLTKEFASEIGADAYAGDAMETVRYAEGI